MFPKLPAFLSDPRKLLAVAALCAAAGLIAGYVLVHDEADRTLALRQGPPPAVALQSYSEERDLGPAREVVIHAETDLDSPLTLTVRGSDPQRTVIAFPLFRVSDLGQASVISSSGTAAGGLGAQVSRRTGAPQAAPEALGVMLFEMGARPVEGFDARAYVESFGAGRFGTVVEVNGEVVDPGDVVLMIDGALSVKNTVLTQDFLTVRPYVEGRIAALRPMGDGTDRSRVFFWLALIFAGSAVVLWLRGYGPKDARSRLYDRERMQQGHHALSTPASNRFDPISTQEEVTENDARREPSLIERVLWSILMAAVRGVARVKSPR